MRKNIVQKENFIINLGNKINEEIEYRVWEKILNLTIPTDL